MAKKIEVAVQKKNKWDIVKVLIKAVILAICLSFVMLIFGFNLSAERELILLGISILWLTVNNKLILLAGIFFLILLWILADYNRDYNLTCLIQDGFPGDYNTQNVTIYNTYSSMMGGYSLVIYGNGSTYYLSILHGSTARAGVLPQEKIGEIVNLFKDKKFFCLKDKYDNQDIFSLSEPDFTTLSFTIDGITKTVRSTRYGSSPFPSYPQSIYEINDELGKSAVQLPQVKPENADDFCLALKKEIDKENADLEYWTRDCRIAVNVSYQGTK